MWSVLYYFNVLYRVDLSMRLLMYSWDVFNGNCTAVWDEVGVLTHVTDLLYCATVRHWSTIGRQLVDNWWEEL
jgi:hypothetical protein